MNYNLMQLWLNLAPFDSDPKVLPDFSALVKGWRHLCSATDLLISLKENSNAINSKRP